MSTTLRELSEVLVTSLPSKIPNPLAGTRSCFRIVYPDSSDGRGHYLGRDLGDVVISGTTFQAKGDDGRGGLASEPQTLPLQGHNTERMLGDFQFVIGDFVECAILPPLEDGSVMPTITSSFRPIGGPGIIGDGRASGDSGSGRPGRDAGRGEPIPLGHWSSSTFANHLPPKEYHGHIEGVDISWTPRAVSRLPADALLYGENELDLKAATESVVHASARRHNQTRAVILYGLIHALITNIRCSNRLIEGHSIQLPPLPIA